MRKLLVWGLLALICLGPVRAQDAPGLTLALDKILASPTLAGGITGAMVCRADNGAVLYAHDADTRLLPASNRKLFTAASALCLLGPNFRARTEVLAAVKPDASGTVHGTLYLRGGGDGLLSAADLDTLAAALVGQGVKKVDGNVAGDGSRFSGGPYGFGWEWDDFSDEEFPQISGLEVNEGVLAVHIAAGNAIGDPVRVTLTPETEYVSLIVSARTGAKNAVPDCAAERPWDKNYFRVTGTLPVGQTLDVNVPVKDPDRLAATLFRAALMRHDIVVTGPAVSGQTPAGAATLAFHDGLPLSETLARMNKPSDNLLAECFVRLLSPVGSYDAGHELETPVFQKLGVDTDKIALVDGCGVGRRDFVTARAVTALLVGMHRRPDWQLYYNSLPIAGVDGTLKGRMKGTAAQNNVHAKTGTLSQVRALSGYVTGKDGHLYVFSLLMNNFPGKAKTAGDVQDKFVEELANSL